MNGLLYNRSENRFSEKNWAKFQAGGAYSGGAYKRKSVYSTFEALKGKCNGAIPLLSGRE